MSGHLTSIIVEVRLTFVKHLHTHLYGRGPHIQKKKKVLTYKTITSQNRDFTFSLKTIVDTIIS